MTTGFLGAHLRGLLRIPAREARAVVSHLPTLYILYAIHGLGNLSHTVRLQQLMKNTKGLIKKDGVREVVCIRGIKICAEYVSLLYD